MSLFQVVMAWAVKAMAWWKVMLASYALAGTASQNLFTAQHELSHFLAFRKPLYNRILSIASNCPLCDPDGYVVPQIPSGAPLSSGEAGEIK